MFKALIYRVVGPPPASGATREERLRWIRKFYWFNLAAIVLFVIVALVGGGSFVWIVVTGLAVLSAGGLASISISIRQSQGVR